MTNTGYFLMRGPSIIWFIFILKHRFAILLNTCVLWRYINGGVPCFYFFPISKHYKLCHHVRSCATARLEGSLINKFCNFSNNSVFSKLYNFLNKRWTLILTIFSCERSRVYPSIGWIWRHFRKHSELLQCWCTYCGLFFQEGRKVVQWTWWRENQFGYDCKELFVTFFLW